MKLGKLARLFFAMLFGLAGIITALGQTAAQEASPTASPPVTAESIAVSGEVANPGPLTIADLQALATETVDVTYRAEGGDEESHSYTGARLWDVLQLAQPNVDPAHPESSLQMYITFVAKDGYVVVISMGEVDPEFGAQPYLLAWQEDGNPLSGDFGPVTLVTPGDLTDGRYIHGVVSIEVSNVSSEDDD